MADIYPLQFINNILILRIKKFFEQQHISLYPGYSLNVKKLLSFIFILFTIDFYTKFG